MTARDFDASIRSSYHFLLECKIIRSATALQSHSASQQFVELALTPSTPYRDLFLSGLRNGDYNFLLSDYAFIQFTFVSKQHFRFAFYPNPFVVDDSATREWDALVRDGLMSFEEYSSLLSEQAYEITKPCIRFELDCGAYVRLLHPAAHFHIGMHAENRWPICRRLTPRSFSLLIAKLYYGNEWSHGILRQENNGYRNRFDRYFVQEKTDCPLLERNLFHDHERGQMHFA